MCSQHECKPFRPHTKSFFVRNIDGNPTRNCSFNVYVNRKFGFLLSITVSFAKKKRTYKWSKKKSPEFESFFIYFSLACHSYLKWIKFLNLKSWIFFTFMRMWEKKIWRKLDWNVFSSTFNASSSALHFTVFFSLSSLHSFFDYYFSSLFLSSSCSWLLHFV